MLDNNDFLAKYIICWYGHSLSELANKRYHFAYFQSTPFCWLVDNSPYCGIIFLWIVTFCGKHIFQYNEATLETTYWELLINNELITPKSEIIIINSNNEIHVNCAHAHGLIVVITQIVEGLIRCTPHRIWKALCRCYHCKSSELYSVQN